MFKFTGREALIFKDKYLVISDLHIGIERELFTGGINLPAVTDYLIKKLEDIYSKSKVSNLIIVGDLKHNVPKVSLIEMKEIPYFLDKISEYFERIYILKGNHDGGLEKIVEKKDNIKILKEIKIGNVVFSHGHKRNVLDGRVFVIGHHHFVINIRSIIGESFYEKVFVSGTFDEREVIILPAFSDLAGYWEVGNFHGPIAKKIKAYNVFTLEGVLLKEVWI